MKGAWPIVAVVLVDERDVVLARRRARDVAELLGFEHSDQTRIATAVSEIARNAFEAGGRARVAFSLSDGREGTQSLLISITDGGAESADPEALLVGSPNPRANGFVNAKRLVDELRFESGPGGGAIVELRKLFSGRQKAVTQKALRTIAMQLGGEHDETKPLAVLAERNLEAVAGLEELRLRQEELKRLNRELEETNRGVVALYAELDERAEQLRQASETKTRFLSNMSHEFRTPLNSILALSRLLLDRVDGSLSVEQARQVGFIKQSAETLAELVDDLLDIAKVEAGKVDIRSAEFEIADLFGALRGALKPLQKDAVALIFEEPKADALRLVSDEAKIAQILRNFISNALKFTSAGEVRVSAHYEPREKRTLFRVSDTGIGIAVKDRLRIFEEFVQIDTPLHKGIKGTGLGLSLSRKLAELLQGEILIESELGRGSVFTLSVPSHPQSVRTEGADRAIRTAEGGERLILVVDDDEVFRYALTEMIKAADPSYKAIEASGGSEALNKIGQVMPDAIFLDLHMPRVDGFSVFAELSVDPRTRAIPVMISTSFGLDEAARKRLSRAHAILSKADLSLDLVRATLANALGARR